MWEAVLAHVLEAVSGVFGQFLRLQGAYSGAFSLVLSLTIVYFIVRRIAPISTGAESDKVKPKRKE